MPSSWLKERVTPHDYHGHEFKKILVQAKTPFQNVTLADTYSFGRCLVLDNEIQSACLDEFIYHECLVHPAMAFHPRPQNILILGGGEGATVREILRHPSVRRVTMVDIDEAVLSFCKKYLKEWHQGALEHAKLNLVIEDAGKFIAETRERFDIIFSDLPTPQPGHPVAKLYSMEFYEQLRMRLKSGGVLVVQSGSGSLPYIHFHARVKQVLGKVFKIVRSYYAFIPSFDEAWSFVMASQKADPRKASGSQINRKLGTFSQCLRFYDGEAHEGLFRIPKYLRQLG
jgi:spermidine synthase